MQTPKDSALPANVEDLLLDAICVVDTRDCFVAITGACVSIFGYTPEEMIGRPVMDFVFHEDRDRTQGSIERVMDGHVQRHFENRYVRKDGEIVHILWTARWSEAGQVRVGVARDITERVRAGVPARRWRLSSSPRQLTSPGFSPITLSGQDYTVLLTVAESSQPVSRETIVRALGKNFLEYDQRRLDTQMRRLRRKVEAACGMQLPISTLRGVGYHFYEEIEICR